MTFSGLDAMFAAQTPGTTQPAAAQGPKTPSLIMQPALDTLQHTLGVLRTEKWKTSSAVREETDTNISSIRRDLETTLPPLLATADGSPDSFSQVLPAFRNVEALYDVLLRVAEAGRISAPSQQNAALEQAMASLEAGRRALGDHLQSVAVARDQQLRDLQAAVRAIPPAPVSVPAACPPPPPPKKRRRSAKPTEKPVPVPVNPQSGAAPSH
jgi:hypothetical protein